MIKSFADKETRKLYEGKKSKAVPPDVVERAESKLKVLDAATSLKDLEVPPGNRLEPLKGERKGRHSIRVNRAYRVCFVFDDGDAYEVEVSNHYER